MNRVEKFNQLARLEKRKNDFEIILSDLKDFYFKEATIYVSSVRTQNWSDTKRGTDDLKVDPTLFRQYVKNEINELDFEITKMLRELNEL